MRRRSLPPVGAITQTTEICPTDKLYLVSPAPGDHVMSSIWVSPDGVRVKGNGNSKLLKGLLIWNRDIWESVEFYVRSLNLKHDPDDTFNDYNDAYLFRNYDLAWKFADFCLAAPGKEKWVDLPNGVKHRTGVMPFLSERIGDWKRPSYE